MTRATRRFISPTAEETKHLREEIDSSPNEEEFAPPRPTASSSDDDETPDGSGTVPKVSLSIDQLYEAERETNKVNYWRGNYFAAGLVEPTWNDELRRMVGRPGNDDGDSNGPNRSCCEDVVSEQIDPTCGCLICSAFVFSKIGAGRIGNMAVLKESSVMVEVPLNKDEEENDSADAGHRLERQRKIDIIVGPYWPCLIFVTFPIVIVLSVITAVKAVFIPGQHIALQIVFSVLFVGLVFALFEVGCRDPGIVRKHRESPSVAGYRSDEWKWNDQSQSFKPRDAFYDPDCAVVIEAFDHTCPWTGTAIGKRNMWAFQLFVGLVFICLPMDIMLLAAMSS